MNNDIEDPGRGGLDDAGAGAPADWSMLRERVSGLEFRRLRDDAELQRLLVQLCREYLERSSVSREKLEQTLEREDLKPADLWAPGLSETMTVGSTEEELTGYRKKLEFRVQLLLAILEASLDELERSAKWRPVRNGIECEERTEDSEK